MDLGRTNSIVARSAIPPLREIRENDYPRMFEWVNTRSNRIQSGAFRPVSWYEHIAWLEATLGDKNSVLLAIDPYGNGELVGHVLLSNISTLHRNCELSIRIGDESQRNRGIGTEAVTAALVLAKADLGLHRVQLSVLADNSRAKRVYTKSGFVIEGLLRQAVFVDGHFRDLLVMAALLQ